MQSLRESLASLTPSQIDDVLAKATPEQVRAWRYDWPGILARPNQLAPPGNWLTWLILAGRGFGKMIHHKTEIPTPSGWSVLGEMKIGDELFDESGRVCRILAVFDGTPRKAYRLTFSDGSTIDACDEHQWVTWMHRDRKAYLRATGTRDTNALPLEWPAWRSAERRGNAAGPAIRTTQQIVDTLRQGRRGDLNHCIPVCGALDLPRRKLPIDPYVLGMWLGNGSKADGSITVHQDDMAEVRAKIEAAGYVTTERTERITFGTIGLHKKLREMDLLHNKHIPQEYLRASANQRIELLRGLMDSDGYCAPGGNTEFCNTDKALAEGVLELFLSLGQKATMSEGRATLYGKDCGPKYRVNCTPTTQVFSTTRKSGMMRKGSQGFRLLHRMIVSAEPIEPVPMRCLTVDSKHSMFLAGRAMIPTHNTRTGAEWVRAHCENNPNARMALVGRTAADVRDVMVEGESGIMSCCPPHNRPTYTPSNRRLVWPNGAQATTFSAEEPDMLRGIQSTSAWCDELAAWRYPDAWDQLRFGLRLGNNPQAMVTTTPRPVALLRAIMREPTTVVTRGSTYDNLANLAPSFRAAILSKYEGTTLGRQEIHAELLDEMPGALWQRANIDAHRAAECPQLARLVVAVDPATTATKDSDETGIVVAGAAATGQGYVLADASMRGSPDAWARRAVEMYRHHRADRITYEANQGGDMVASVIRHVDPTVPLRAVHASRGKRVRAEPIAALYEQGRVHHVGIFGQLEDQLCNWVPGADDSPDRLDALVWCLTDVMEFAAAPISIGNVDAGGVSRWA